MFDIYDASVREPTTLEGLAEFMRVRLLGKNSDDYAGTFLPVFRKNRQGVWERKKLLVWGDKREHGPTLTFHLTPVKKTRIVNGKEEDEYYKTSLLIGKDLPDMEKYQFDESNGHPTKPAWKAALKELHLCMTEPKPGEDCDGKPPVPKSPRKRHHMR